MVNERGGAESDPDGNRMMTTMLYHRTSLSWKGFIYHGAAIGAGRPSCVIKAAEVGVTVASSHIENGVGEVRTFRWFS